MLVVVVCVCVCVCELQMRWWSMAQRIAATHHGNRCLSSLSSCTVFLHLRLSHSLSLSLSLSLYLSLSLSPSVFLSVFLSFPLCSLLCHVEHSAVHCHMPEMSLPIQCGMCNPP